MNTAQILMALLSKLPVPAIVFVVFVLGHSFNGMVCTALRTARISVEKPSEIGSQGNGLVLGKEIA